MQEQLTSTRTEKETLEGILFDTQTNLEATHIKKTQLEKEQKEILIKQEGLNGQIARLTKELENSEKCAQDIKQSLTQQSGDQIAEFQQIISNMKKQSEDNIKKMNDEKVLFIKDYGFLGNIVLLYCISNMYIYFSLHTLRVSLFS